MSHFLFSVRLFIATGRRCVCCAGKPVTELFQVQLYVNIFLTTTMSASSVQTHFPSLLIGTNSARLSRTRLLNMCHSMKRPSALREHEGTNRPLTWMLPVCCAPVVQVLWAEWRRWPTCSAGRCASWSACVCPGAGRKPECCSSASSSPTLL